MTIRFLKPFLKDYKRLPEPIRSKVDRNIKLLAQDLRHPGVKARKMVGGSDVWEGRVDEHYRLTFCVLGDVLVMRRVGTHQIYKKP